MKFKWFIVICIGLLFFEKSSCKNVFHMSADFDKVLYEQHMKKGIAQNGPPFAFAKHFQDHMVLQQAPRRANIYGFSPDIGQKVIMQLVTVPPTRPYYYETTTVQGPDANLGYWNFMLDPFPSNTTVNINIQAEAGSLNLNDVIFGDVWICSGQSNMQFTVIQMDDAESELADAANYPNIRLMTVNMNESTTVQYDLIQIEENWTKPSRDTLGATAWTYFSAVCWLFGKNIHKQRGDPIGLVATDWGGTPVEAWSSPQALAACGDSPKPKVQLPASYKSYLNQLSPKERHRLEGPGDNSVLWNAMVHPLLGMTIYGAIWYQGEADASGARMNNYNCTFPAMINDWRANFNKASNGQTSVTFPFGFVQLSGNSPDPTISVGFPDIRWHQTADVGYVPNQKMVNVFMAVAMDLPDFTSSYGAIHPRDKKDVGARLALSGLAVAYGKPEVYQGPFPVKAYISSVGLVVDYGNSWSLNIKNWEGFELQCGGNWVPTPIISSNQTSITLFTGGCKTTVTGLRYAWRESPCGMLECAIYESVNNLPAPPFIVFAKSSNGKPYFTFDEPTYL